MQELINLFQENVVTISMMLITLGITMLVNMILGAIMAGSSGQFNLKRFLLSILKALLICLCVITYCCILQIIPEILKRIEITISSDFLTFIEVISVVYVSVKKYCVEIYKKLLVLLDVKEEEVEMLDERID